MIPLAAGSHDITALDYRDFAVRLAIDLAALLIIAGALYVRRHYRRDRFFVFAIFNLGVFGVLAVITQHKISASVGFGLFALLSIIRLRSEPFANVELGYFFVALVLGVVNGISHSDFGLEGVVSAVVVTGVFAFDHPRIQTAELRRRVTLDAVYTDLDELHTELEKRFGLTILDLRITSIDYVRETTSVTIRFLDRRGRRDFGDLREDGDEE